MARIWNAANDLQNVATLGVAKPIAKKWARNLLDLWCHMMFSPMGMKKKLILLTIVTFRYYNDQPYICSIKNKTKIYKWFNNHKKHNLGFQKQAIPNA